MGWVAQDPLTQFGFFSNFMAASEQMVWFLLSFFSGTSGACSSPYLGYIPLPGGSTLVPTCISSPFWGIACHGEALGVLGQWLAPTAEAARAGPARATGGGCTRVGGSVLETEPGLARGGPRVLGVGPGVGPQQCRLRHLSLRNQLPRCPRRPPQTSPPSWRSPLRRSCCASGPRALC